MPFYTGPYAFLTTKPGNRRFSMDHPEWLFIMPTQDIASAELTCRVVNSVDSASNLNISLGNLQKGKVIWVDISDSVRSYDDYADGNPIKYIKFFITDEVYDNITCYPYNPAGDDVRALYYLNSFGGLDSIIIEGQIQDTVNYDYQEVIRPAEVGYTLASDMLRKHQVTRADKHVTVNTGHKPGSEILALQDLFLTRVAFEYKVLEPDYPFQVPIVPIDNQLALPSNRQNIKQATFSYMYATRQRAYDRVT